MKISYLWEESDITAGRRVEAGINEWMIGFNSPHKASNKYVLVALSDGLVLQIGSVDDFVKYLNKHKLAPICPTLSQRASTEHEE